MKKITDYAELVKAKHALNKTIAPVEDGASMAGSYTSGKQFIRDSVLYSALTSIAAGTAWSSLTLDTDYEVADDVSTQIAAVNQTLTNEVANEIATRSKLGAHNFVSMKLSPYKAQANNYVSIGTQTDSQLAFTTENHNYADVQLAYALPIGNYKASIGEITASDSYTPIINIYFLDASGQNVKPTVSLTSNQTKDFEIDASVAYILISFLGTQGTATAAIRTVTFNNLMFRLATDESADYEPYAMTNQELTEDVQNIDSILNSTYQFMGTSQKSVTGDGVKTYKEKLDELSLALKAEFETKPNNWRGEYRLIYVQEIGTMPSNGSNMIGNSSNVSVDFTLIKNGSIWNVGISSSGEQYQFIKTIALNTTGCVTTDKINDIVPNGYSIVVQWSNYLIAST